MEIPAIMTYEQEKEEKLKLAREKLKQFRRLKKEREIPTANDPSPPPLNIAPSSDGTYQTHCNSQEAANASFLPPYPEYVPLPVLPAGSFYDTSHSPATASSMHLQDLPPPIQPQQTLVEQPQQNLAEQPQQTLSHQVSSLQETVSQSQIIHKEEIEKIKNSYEDRINDLSSSIQIYVSEKSELSLELEKTRKESVSQKEGIKSLEGKIEELISTKAGEFEDTKKLEIKEEEVKVLQKELSDVNETVINQKHELSEITSKFKSKVDLAEDFERKYVDTKAQLEMTELNLSQMQIESKDKRVSELTAYIQQSNGERDQIINQYTSYSQQLVAQIEALNKTLNEKLEENSRLKEKLMTQQAESEKLKSESLSVVENVEDMKCKMNDLQEMHDQLEKEKGLLVAQCDDQENKIQELSIALEESLSKMSSMETEMEMLRSNFETAPLNSNINLMESMESDKVAASRAMSQNQELKEQLMELQSALVNLTNAKAKLMNELDDLKRQNSFLEQCTKESEGVKINI
ncbi:GOLGA2 [Lepeophtheirus salmonis]|uniref:GOLGA2 n=1 Tax=Lepeophtheirus salmonis TaxID=72036 RepID=A0A7R8CDV5_LEPSM|nr:GOLGA2 [Lepeophtheirus salmonis]CAF2783752.1 GOLGA2 [Lepeophtheirus salmonis]